MTNKIKLILSILLPQVAGGLGGFLMGSSVSDWYLELQKSVITPPDWVFGPVWVTLYLLMGIAAYLVWKRVNVDRSAKKAMNIYWIHLALNASWTPIFFGLQNIFLALVNIVILWILILILIFKFYKIKKTASYLLIPYILWVSIATYLNYTIWILN